MFFDKPLKELEGTEVNSLGRCPILLQFKFWRLRVAFRCPQPLSYATRLKPLAGCLKSAEEWKIQPPFSSRRREKGKGRTWLFSAGFCIFSLFIIFLLTQATQAQSPIQVGLVVQSAEGNVMTKCVTLNQTNPSGWEVLVAANVDVKGSPSGMGMAVCAIAGVGCPPEDCWCKFNSGENLYWSYWHLKEGRWVYSNLGASNYPVSQGDVEGWIWGQGQTPPPLVPFEQICAPSPTATFTLAPMHTTTFTQTRTPSATSTQTVAPSATSTQSVAPSATSTQTVAPSATPVLFRTSTLTPSPTITLPFGIAVAATTVAPAQNLPQSVSSPSSEMVLDLQSLSMTATAVEAARQSELLQEEGKPEDASSQMGFGTQVLDIAYVIFLVLVGGLLILLIVLVRRRGAI